MRNYFTLGGVDSRTCGVYISGQGTFNSPARELNLIAVPGRDGDLIGLEKRLQNVELTYAAFIYSNFDANVAALRSLLLSDSGYRRLTDTYHPNEFRMAAYRGPLTVSPTRRNNAGQFNIVFQCMPKRYLISGESAQTFTADGSITNPTSFPAQPLLRVYGTGTVGIGSDTITISSADGYTDIDCAMMRAYKGAVACDANITVSGIDFPVLAPGENGITLDGVTQVDITPRWWIV